MTEDSPTDIKEEVDWVKFAPILQNYDPTPNFSKFKPQETNVLSKFDFEYDTIPGVQFTIDCHTRIILYKLLKSKILSKINGFFDSGNESLILHAVTFENEECVIKVFKANFLNIQGLSEPEERKLIQKCAFQEMINLRKLNEIGVPCPKIIHFRKHILVMSFIGNDQMGAPILELADLTIDEYEEAYQQVVDCLIKSYQKNLIHSEISPKNILWYQKKCYFIDVSQSISKDNPKAEKMLMKGCQNINTFFSSKGVVNIIEAVKLFTKIVNCN